MTRLFQNNTWIGMAIVLIFSLSSTLGSAAEVHGVLRVVKGQVQIKSGKSGQVSRGRLGGKVFPLDTIITGKDSRAKVVMIDNNEINVAPESEIKFENYEYNPEKNKKNVLLNVIYGKVRSKVNQKYDDQTNKFQVKTSSAVAGVRGTDFITSFSPRTKQTQVVTFEGQVAFGLPGPNGTIAQPVMVRVGQMTSVVGSSPPAPPIEVPKSELAKIDLSSDAEKSDTAGERSPSNNGSENKRSEDKEKSDDPSKDKPEKKSPDKKEAAATGNSKEKAPAAGGSAKGAAPKDASANSGPKDQANNKGPTAETGRAPASNPAAGGGAMLRPEDMPAISGAEPVLPPSFGSAPIPNFDSNMNQIPQCDACRQFIEIEGNNSLLLRVTIGP